LPKQNERDLDELPEDVRNAMTFVPVEQIEEAIKVAFLSEETEPKPPIPVQNKEQLPHPEAGLH
jgi:ATP-dependent Lon protease